MEPTLKQVTLRRGLQIGDTTHRDAVVRESTAGDLFAAERDAGTDTPLAFAGAMLCRQLLRVGSYEGPFTLEILGKLTSDDFGRLRDAQEEADALGEANEGDAATASTPSS